MTMKGRPSNQNCLATAADVRASAPHHEAGHAVVAYLHGVRHQSITVCKDGRGHFECDRQTLTAQAETMIAMAGVAAEYLHHNPGDVKVPLFSESIESHKHLWSDTDLHDAQKHSEFFSPKEQRRFREQYWERTWRMLRSHWASIQAVAAAAVEKQTLTDRQIWDLIGQESW